MNAFSAAANHDLGLKRIRRELEPTVKSAHDSALSCPWADLGDRIHPKMNFTLTSAFHFSHATAVQRRCVPLLSQVGHSAIVEAATGCGKTLAFLIPLVQRCLSYHDFFYIHSDRLKVNGVLSSEKRPPLTRAIMGVIVCPTRALSEQTFIVARQLACRVPHAIQFFLCDPILTRGSHTEQFHLSHYQGVLEAVERCPRTTGIALVGRAVDILAVCQLIATRAAHTAITPVPRRLGKTPADADACTPQAAVGGDDEELDAATIERMRDAARARREAKLAATSKRARDDDDTHTSNKSEIHPPTDIAMVATLNFPLSVAIRAASCVDNAPMSGVHCYYADFYSRFLEQNKSKKVTPLSNRGQNKGKGKVQNTDAGSAWVRLPTPRPLVIIDEADVILRDINYGTCKDTVDNVDEDNGNILDRLMTLFADSSDGSKNEKSPCAADFALVGATVNTPHVFRSTIAGRDKDAVLAEKIPNTVSLFIKKWFREEDETALHKIKIGTDEQYLSQLKNRFILFGHPGRFQSATKGDSDHDTIPNSRTATTETISYHLFIPELITLINKHPSKKHIVFCENIAVLKYVRALLRLLAGDSDTQTSNSNKK